MRAEANSATAGAGLVALFDRAMPEVYHYLFHRVRDRSLAEDLTAETFLAAVAAAPTPSGDDRSVAWLIGIARHKLADHWRKQAREERRLAAVAGEAREDAWDGPIEEGRAAEVLSRLNPAQRAALTLRYVDGLPVAEVAALLGRTLHGTETLLTRAKAAFRHHYENDGDVAS